MDFPRFGRPGRWRCCAASGDASQKSSILVASDSSTLREIAHISTGSPASLRCDRGVPGATRATDPAPTVRTSSPKRIVSVPRVDVELLDLVVVVPGALLEVRVRRHADQRDRHLLGAEGAG